MNEIIDELYKEAAAFHNIPLEQFRDATTRAPLIQQFYEHKYNWDPKTQDPPW